MPAYLPCRFLV